MSFYVIRNINDNDNTLLTKETIYAIIEKIIPMEGNYADIYGEENAEFRYSQQYL